MGYGVRFLAQGQRACFSRPEMKAERVSYDVLTPSAARGLLEAIYWKPAIKWHIDTIEVLNEIQFDTFRRNEVGGKLSYDNAKSALKNSKELYTIASEDRQQRATLYLKNVAYVVEAHFELTDVASSEDTVEKHYNIALRRLRKGQCFYQPYFGCKEFPASVSLMEKGEGYLSHYRDVTEKDLGFMLFDIDFDNERTPQFFRAIMKQGIIDIAAARGGVVG